jgi:hypothetical protein
MSRGLNFTVGERFSLCSPVWIRAFLVDLTIPKASKYPTPDSKRVKI